MRRFAALAGCALALSLPAAADAKPHVYVTGTGGVAALSINANGSLSPLPGSPFPTGGVNPDGVALTPDGSKLYVANQSSHNVSRFQVNADGTLTSLGPPVPSGGSGPIALAPSVDGRYLYVVNLSDSISGFEIGSGGGLTPLPGSPFGIAPASGPRVLSVSPDGRFLFVPNNGSTDVSSFQINGDGTLTQIGTPTDTGGSGVVNSAVTADGRHVYANNWFSNTIAAFDVGENGGLTAVSGSPFPSGSGTEPMGLRPSLDGSRLYAAFWGSDQIGTFEIASSGGLVLIPGGTVPAGAADPQFPVQTPEGQRLYVSHQGPGNNVSGFNIGPSGLLTAIPGSPFVSGVGSTNFEAIAVAPNQGPAAQLTATVTDRSQRTVGFDAAGSADPDGGVVTYSFDFGDGQTQTGESATATHTYAQPGTYTATVSVTDNEGCSSRFVSTGQTASCNGGPRATARTQVDIDPPDLRLSGRRTQELDSFVFVKAGCDEPCTATGKGRLLVEPGRSTRRSALKVARYKLGKKTRSISAGGKRKLKLKIPRRAQRAAKVALSQRRGDAVAKIKVSAVDPPGNRARGKRKIKLN